MSSKIDRYIPEQKNTSQYIGGLKELFGRTSFYVTMINFLLLIVTAYYTTIRFIIPISFLVFLTIVIILVCVAMLVEYVVILPSSVVFQNHQAYKHSNPLKDDIKLILNRLDDIENKLGSDDEEYS